MSQTSQLSLHNTTLRTLALTTLAVATALAAGSSAVAQNGRAEVVGDPVTPFVFEGDLRDLPKARSWRPGDAIKEVPRRGAARLDDVSHGLTPGRGQRDPLLDIQAAAPPADAGSGFDSLLLNFAGQGFSGAVPPDTVGEIGKSHYVQMINGGGSQVTFYNKDGSIATGPFILDSLGSGDCATGGGDPIALYDTLAERWVLSEFNGGFGPSALCVYVSRTSDPITGGWFSYAFNTGEFPDYPKYAVWPNAYWVTSNESTSAIYGLDRVNMIAGNTARAIQRFTAPELEFGFNAMTPADVDGKASPPGGSPGYIMRHRDDESHNPGSADPDADFLEVWEYEIDFNNPGNSSFELTQAVPTSEFDSNLCGLTSFSCVEQPSGPDLDPIREVLMWRVAYRNMGSHEVIVGNLVVDADGDDLAGIRWFELRKTGNEDWSLFQEGTWSPSSLNRWMGSIAMDGAGNMALGYNVANNNVFPGLRYTGRLSTDPLGTMPQGENQIVGGQQSNSGNRYGDYAAMNIDPEDDCTFWFTSEYNPSGTTWATRIASMRFDSCLAGGGLAIDSITPCIAGTSNDWAVSGATPGGDVTVTCNIAGSPNEVTVGTETANGNGAATIARVVPANGSGATIECQAEDLTTSQLSPITVKTFD